MNSKYDDKLHLRIVDQSYIGKLTGIDIIQEEGNETKALGKINSFHLKAYNKLTWNKSSKVKNAINYLIKFNKDWASAWENYVISFIESFFNGTEDYVYGDGKMPQNVIEAMQPLNTYNFTYDVYEEIEKSTEVW